MKCPDCGAKISQKHYDPVYEWFECPKCEGAFTYDEIIEAEPSKNEKKPKAKGKIRQEEIAEDKKRAEEMVEEIVKAPVKTKSVAHHRDELPSDQVVPIFADEIQAVYEEMGVPIDEVNAQDKALIIWRELRYLHGITAREQAVPHAVCGAHE